MLSLALDREIVQELSTINVVKLTVCHGTQMEARLQPLTQEMMKEHTFGWLMLMKIMMVTIPQTKVMVLLTLFQPMGANGMTLMAMDMEIIQTLRLHPMLV